MADTPEHLITQCCVVGGGPAGLMTGLLLARAGVEVVVLEKHQDFFRDFRGDTIHPSTLEVIHELGLLEAFLGRPHQEMSTLGAVMGGQSVQIADFSHLPMRCKFIAFMPQWDFLRFLADRATAYQNFGLRMETDAIDLIIKGGRVAGIHANSPAGPVQISADLVIAADGRQSTVRQKAQLPLRELGVPIDVLWFRLAKNEGFPSHTLGYLDTGQMIVLIHRGDYFQCGYIIRKGQFAEIKQRGLNQFQQNLARLVPFLRNAVGEIDDWDKIKLLTVQVNRLEKWFCPGLLCLGDAAHAMSPVGGIGINLAIQDAVAAANLLATPLRAGEITTDLLRSFQMRREKPTRRTQAMQTFAHRRVVRLLESRKPLRLPIVFRLLNWLPVLRRFPARFVGMGFLPEHILLPERSGRRT